MRFVEETEGTWTAVQLKAVEAEIEQQKRDWEANRLAEQQKEEEAAKLNEKEGNELLTFSREDANNQVIYNNTTKNSNKLKKIVNKRVENIKKSNQLNTNMSRNQKLIRKRKANANNFNVEAKTKTRRQTFEGNALNDDGNKNDKKKIIRNNNHNNTINRKSPRYKRAQKISENSNDINTVKRNSSRLHSENKTNTNNKLEANEISKISDSDDSSCSLLVMIDSNDGHDSESNQQMKNYDSSNDDDEDEAEEEEEDEESEEDNDSDRVEDDSVSQDSNLNSNVSSSSQVDISTPRTTRSRGTVPINLWTLDVSPILPSTRRGRTLNLEKNHYKNSYSEDNSKNEDEISKGSFDTINESNLKELKILVEDVTKNRDKIIYPTPINNPNPPVTMKNKRGPNKKIVNIHNNTLDNWVTKSSSKLNTTSNGTLDENLAQEKRTRNNSILKVSENCTL